MPVMGAAPPAAVVEIDPRRCRRDGDARGPVALIASRGRDDEGLGRQGEPGAAERGVGPSGSCGKTDGVRGAARSRVRRVVVRVDGHGSRATARQRARVPGGGARVGRAPRVRGRGAVSARRARSLHRDAPRADRRDPLADDRRDRPAREAPRLPVPADAGRLPDRVAGDGGRRALHARRRRLDARRVLVRRDDRARIDRVGARHGRGVRGRVRTRSDDEPTVPDGAVRRRRGPRQASRPGTSARLVPIRVRDWDTITPTRISTSAASASPLGRSARNRTPQATPNSGTR